MRNWILLLGLLIGLNSFAQEKNAVNINEEPSYSCKVINYDSENNTLELLGNVNFKSDIIALDNADKIVMNKSTNEIIVTGLKKFTIDGSVQVKDRGEKKILKYTIGERIAYLE